MSRLAVVLFRNKTLHDNFASYVKTSIFHSSKLHVCQFGSREVCTSTVKLHDALCCTQTSSLYFKRNGSFFNKLSAEQIWKGVTGVSNPGKKRGRGKGQNRIRIRDLNRGQVIGVGTENMVWPGLNAPIIRGKELVQQRRLADDLEREAMLVKIRDKMGTFRRLKLDPLERGFSGTKLPGRSIGPPVSVTGESFDNFDVIVLEMKSIASMTASFGRLKRFSMFVVSGNKNGLVSIALCRGNTIRSVSHRARKRVGQQMVHIERYNDHTVFHDFFSQFGASKVFVSKVPEGFGLVCHRAIRCICQCVGIKDIYVKVEGSTNIQNVAKAFILGLLRQRTHQQMADDKRLHLVEFREENMNYPKVVASPQTGPVRKADEIPPSEELNYSLYTLDGRVMLKKKKYPPFYTKLPSYDVHLKKFAVYRNREKVILKMLERHGKIKSFYSDQYPEANPGYKHQPE